MDWENVKDVDLSKANSHDPGFWVTLFAAKPEALYDLLYDVYATKKGKLGRGRRKKMNGSLDELWSLVYGEEK
jgi:hypothetical protein